MLGAALVLLGVPRGRLLVVEPSGRDRLRRCVEQVRDDGRSDPLPGGEEPLRDRRDRSAFLARALVSPSARRSDSSRANLLVLLIVVVLAVRTRTLPRRAPRLCPLLDLMTLAYYAGILAMYIFSMPIEEAASLDGFDRLRDELRRPLRRRDRHGAHPRIRGPRRVRADVGAELRDAERARLAYQRAVLAGLAICALVLTSEYAGMRASAQCPAGSNCGEDRGPSPPTAGPREASRDERRYLFYYGSDRDGLMTNFYFTYVSRYLKYAPNVDAIVSFYEDNMDNLLAVDTTSSSSSSRTRSRRSPRRALRVDGAPDSTRSPAKAGASAHAGGGVRWRS
jgi:hypothetical protein